MIRIKKILIANRGEIAIRIEKTARRMGIMTVAIFSEKDSKSLHVLKCDEAYKIDGESLSDTYLNIQKIIQIAQATNCDAIHPGYGFLAEDPNFAKACEEENILFIGPKSEVISVMGNKLQARKLVEEIGIPITKGHSGCIEEIVSKKNSLKFPILVKAAAGGGGKGMRIVHSIDELEESLNATSREAENYFGDGTVYIEKYLESPRHIEVQILGDNYGNIIHLFERECSLQRRYQKIIEEAPSISLDDKKRKEITNAAVQIAKKIAYSSAGTIEFMLDKNLDFYFLEMNTRIQVEHPVTELITGIDIVEQQLKICDGEQLSLNQQDIKISGHAIETRIYAENPEDNFFPSSGKMSYYSSPQNENIRIDSAYSIASEVYSDFDPMISKLISYGKNREEAINHLESALENYYVHGINSNIQFLKHLINNSNYKENNISTSFIEDNLNKLLIYKDLKDTLTTKVICTALLITLKPREESQSVWQSIGYWRIHQKLKFELEGKKHEIKYTKVDLDINVLINNSAFVISEVNYSKNKISFNLNGEYIKCVYSLTQELAIYISLNGFQYKVNRLDILDESRNWERERSEQNIKKNLFSPMPGKVVKINVNEGQEVKKDQSLIIIEAMKMENKLLATHDTIIEKINVIIGQQVDPEIALIEFAENSSTANNEKIIDIKN
ncbi:MAG: biotin/lipoyl-binding protein [Bacteroidales bacterium]|jgi:3-methylcrotonyl-CoA carboxylase alpha subunit|nr:biotin/lipoyl-binding protein [Bacteroidales bacterium]